MRFKINRDRELKVKVEELVKEIEDIKLINGKNQDALITQLAEKEEAYGRLKAAHEVIHTEAGFIRSENNKLKYTSQILKEQMLNLKRPGKAVKTQTYEVGEDSSDDEFWRK
jgi:hypothetical protein